ncbi:MAG: hypothetical protein ACR2HT_01240 [Pyrinomonadaceae bacterium]
MALQSQEIFFFARHSFVKQIVSTEVKSLRPQNASRAGKQT